MNRTAILLSTLLVAGCTGASDTGWRVLSEGHQPLDEGMTAARTITGLTLTLTVPDGGADGCGQPRIEGVERNGSTVVVQVARAPVGAQCLVTGDTTFVLEVGAGLAAGASSATSDDACPFDGCRNRPVPITDE